MCRAADYVQMALQAEPDSISAAFIALKIALQQADLPAACKMVQRLAASSDLDANYLRVRLGLCTVAVCMGCQLLPW